MSNKLKNNAELLNPCVKEQELTYKCFNDYNYDKKACALEIGNYKSCKGFWLSVQADRKRLGKTPHLPPVDEREAIKREYLAQQAKRM